MAVFKPTDSNNWWLSIYQPGGKRKYIPTGTPDKEIAVAIEAQVKSAMKGNLPRSRLIAAIDSLMGWHDESFAGLPVGSIWETYLLTKPRAGKDTINRRRRVTAKLIKWLPEYAPQVQRIHEITPQVAQSFVDWLERENGGKGKTINNRIGNLSAVFNAIVVRAGLDNNPFSFVAKADQSDSISGRAFTEDEIKALMKAGKKLGKNWNEMALLGMYTGMRLTEIANLTWEQVQGDVIDLIPSKTERHGIRVLIPLHSKVVSALAAIRPAPAKGPVFPWIYEYYQKPGNRFERYPTVIKEAGIDPKGALLTFHCWRHTFRTRLAAAEVPQEVAMKLGGWTNESTAEIYNHDLTQLRTAINALD